LGDYLEKERPGMLQYLYMEWKKFFSAKRLYFSFKYAFNGLRVVFLEEQSFRIQLVLAVGLSGYMFAANWHIYTKGLVVLACGLVLGLELINSQIERTLNLLHPQQHPQVKKIKDIAAAAVLVAAAAAALLFALLIKDKGFH
jgi:diacylglycerol kinase